MKESIKKTMETLKQEEKIERAFQILEETHEAIVDLQMELCAIRSPSSVSFR